MPEILPYVVDSLLYAALAFYFWRTRWPRTNETSQRASFTPFEHYAVLIPLVLHTVLLARSAFASDGLHLGIGNAVSTILWLTVLIYWIGNYHYRLDGLQALVLPAAAA